MDAEVKEYIDKRNEELKTYVIAYFEDEIESALDDLDELYNIVDNLDTRLSVLEAQNTFDMDKCNCNININT